MTTREEQQLDEGAERRTVSRALIANGRHRGCVLQYKGPGIENEIDECGLYGLDDLGLDDAPEGLSIWEGMLHTRRVGNPIDGEEWEGELVGTFRPLTADEWGILTGGGLLWPPDPDPEALPPKLEGIVADIFARHAGAFRRLAE